MLSSSIIYQKSTHFLLRVNSCFIYSNVRFILHTCLQLLMCELYLALLPFKFDIPIFLLNPWSRLLLFNTVSEPELIHHSIESYLVVAPSRVNLDFSYSIESFLQAHYIYLWVGSAESDYKWWVHPMYIKRQLFFYLYDVRLILYTCLKYVNHWVSSNGKNFGVSTPKSQVWISSASGQPYRH